MRVGYAVDGGRRLARAGSCWLAETLITLGRRPPPVLLDVSVQTRVFELAGLRHVVRVRLPYRQEEEVSSSLA